MSGRDDEARSLGDSILLQALSQAADSIELLDPDMRVVWVNGAFERLHGRTYDQVAGATPAELSLGSPKFRDRHQEAGDALRAGRAWTGEVVAARADGSEVPVEMTVSPLHGDGGTLRGYLAIKRDRTEAVKARQARERHERELEALLDRVPVGIVVHAEGAIRYANDTISTMLGFDQLAGEDIDRLIHPDDAPAVPSHLARSDRADAQAEPLEVRGRARDERVVFLGIHPLGSIHYRGESCRCAALVDLTVERRKRESAISADRLQIMGQIAAGVAHEVNNPLTWMISGLEESRSDLGRAPEGLRTRLDETLEGAQRIRHVVRELALFTREEPEEESTAALGEVTRAAANLARRAIEARGRLVVDLPDDPIWVSGDAPKLGQVLLNLLLNAAAAFPDTGRGCVEARLRAEGERAVVVVTDDGVGMSDEVKMRAFEPFYTTRAARGGTGLGLPITQTIVADLGGSIEVDTSEGVGTEVRVVLPRASPPEQPASERPSTAARLRVLVVDDERLVATSLRRRIATMGHVAEAVGSANEALELLQARAFDVVLCDLMMPDVDGRALHAILLQKAPEIARRMVFMTGGAFTADAQAFLASLDRPWLVKPFDVDALAAALQHVVEP